MKVSEIRLTDVFGKTEEMVDGEHEIQAAVDWITVTTRDAKVAAAWQEIYQEQKNAYDVEGQLDIEKRWQIMSYQGTGFPGSIRVGFSLNLGWIVIASSTSASKWARLVGPKSNVTRIDLAVTQSLGMQLEDVPKRYYEVIQDADTGRLNYALIQNTKRGQTLYVGSRSSEKFGRLYDKGIEAGLAPAGFKYRWEVEYKKPTANEVATVLKAMKGLKAEQIVSMVYTFFSLRGVPPLFRREGEMVKLEVLAKATSLDRKIQWIRSQVRPSIMRLIMAGRTRDLFCAMGVDISEDELATLERRAEAQRATSTEAFDIEE